MGGSGGGGGHFSSGFRGANGGGGGGAILIVSSTVIDLGAGAGSAVAANGGNGETIPGQYSAGGGSGGGIRLMASEIRGARGLSAVGGQGTYPGGSGRIRLEAARTLAYTGATSPPASASKPGQMGPVFPAITPTVRVTSIAGVAVPEPPTSDVTTPDVSLPANFTNPVRIDLIANNVPSGSRARVIVAPQYGRGYRFISAPVLLLGSAGQPKIASIEVTLPTRGTGIISAIIDSVVPEPDGSGAN